MDENLEWSFSIIVTFFKVTSLNDVGGQILDNHYYYTVKQILCFASKFCRKLLSIQRPAIRRIYTKLTIPAECWNVYVGRRILPRLICFIISIFSFFLILYLKALSGKDIRNRVKNRWDTKLHEIYETSSANMLWKIDVRSKKLKKYLKGKTNLFFRERFFKSLEPQSIPKK